MQQSIVRLPKEDNFEIGGWYIKIQDHKVKYREGLIGMLTLMIGSKSVDRQTLAKFEEYKVSFEAVIEECSNELEDNKIKSAEIIWHHYDITTQSTTTKVETSIRGIYDFSKSEAGRTIINEFIEKIRSCENWKELYDILHPKNKFIRDMKQRIMKAVTP